MPKLTENDVLDIRNAITASGIVVKASENLAVDCVKLPVNTAAKQNVVIAAMQFVTAINEYLGDLENTLKHSFISETVPTMFN